MSTDSCGLKIVGQKKKVKAQIKLLDSIKVLSEVKNDPTFNSFLKKYVGSSYSFVSSTDLIYQKGKTKLGKPDLVNEFDTVSYMIVKNIFLNYRWKPLNRNRTYTIICKIFFDMDENTLSILFEEYRNNSFPTIYLTEGKLDSTRND
jgi:hypothetical protein